MKPLFPRQGQCHQGVFVLVGRPVPLSVCVFTPIISIVCAPAALWEVAMAYPLIFEYQPDFGTYGGSFVKV